MYRVFVLSLLIVSCTDAVFSGRSREKKSTSALPAKTIVQPTDTDNVVPRIDLVTARRAIREGESAQRGLGTLEISHATEIRVDCDSCDLPLDFKYGRDGRYNFMSADFEYATVKDTYHCIINLKVEFIELKLTKNYPYRIKVCPESPVTGDRVCDPDRYINSCDFR